jgi:hypothetical protein
LCGTPNGAISLPPQMSAIAGIGGEVQLFFNNGAQSIQILGPDEVEEVCPLSDGRLVVFGSAARSGGRIFSIVDPTKPSLLDKVLGYDARLSPDQKWIVFRKFHVFNADLPFSDAYALRFIA